MHVEEDEQQRHRKVDAQVAGKLAPPAARASRIRPYQRQSGIRVLASDKVGHRMTMLVMSPGSELTIQRPEHLFNGLALVTIGWDGSTLGRREYEDPEGAFQYRNLTYI